MDSFFLTIHIAVGVAELIIWFFLLRTRASGHKMRFVVAALSVILSSALSYIIYVNRATWISDFCVTILIYALSAAVLLYKCRLGNGLWCLIPFLLFCVINNIFAWMGRAAIEIIHANYTIHVVHFYREDITEILPQFIHLGTSSILSFAATMLVIKKKQLFRTFAYISAVLSSAAATVMLFSRLWRRFIDTGLIKPFAAVIALIPILLAITSIFTLGYIFYLKEENKHSQEELRKSALEMDQIKRTTEMYDYVREWRHDTRNNLATIRSLAERRECEGLLRYIDEMRSVSEHADLIISTENPAFDATVSGKLMSAKNEGIAITHKISVSGVLPVNTLNVCSIFMNLFDNAAEAVKKLPSESRCIDFSVSEMRGMLFICFNNPTDGIYSISKGKLLSTKSDPDHGLGLRHVDNICRSMGGYFTYEARTDSFFAEAVIPLERSDPKD